MNTAESTSRRVLFLDIDGCVSPASRFKGPTTMLSGDWNGSHPVALSLIHELQQLQAEAVEIVLSTSWEDEATEALAPHLGALTTLHAVHGDGWWKQRAISEYLSQHPAHITIMVDDEIPDHGDLPDVTAVIAPEPHLGFTPAHFEHIRSIFFG